MKTLLALKLGACALAYFAVAASAAEKTLQEMLKDTSVSAHWIYDDLDKAVAQAKATGKPLFVTFRCVP